jgi:hypothetical protein
MTHLKRSSLFGRLVFHGAPISKWRNREMITDTISGFELRCGAMKGAPAVDRAKRK